MIETDAWARLRNQYPLVGLLLGSHHLGRLPRRASANRDLFVGEVADGSSSALFTFPPPQTKIQSRLPSSRCLLTSRLFFARSCEIAKMAIVRRAPYKDFLQPSLHRRFSSTASILLAVAFVESVLLASWRSRKLPCPSTDRGSSHD